MIMEIKKLRLEIKSNPIALSLFYRTGRFTTFTLFAVYCLRHMFQVGAVFLGFYFVLGKCVIIEPSELTEEEKKILEQT